MTEASGFFVIAGTVDEIDEALGCIRIGESVVWVPAHVIRGLDLGAPVIVSGHRDPNTGRAIAELVRCPRRILHAPLPPPPIPGAGTLGGVAVGSAPILAM